MRGVDTDFTRLSPSNYHMYRVLKTRSALAKASEFRIDAFLLCLLFLLVIFGLELLFSKSWRPLQYSLFDQLVGVCSLSISISVAFSPLERLLLFGYIEKARLASITSSHISLKRLVLKKRKTVSP
jgi:hypothetical protein